MLVHGTCCSSSKIKFSHCKHLLPVPCLASFRQQTQQNTPTFSPPDSAVPSNPYAPEVTRRDDSEWSHPGCFDTARTVFWLQREGDHILRNSLVVLSPCRTEPDLPLPRPSTNGGRGGFRSFGRAETARPLVAFAPPQEDPSQPPLPTENNGRKLHRNRMRRKQTDLPSRPLDKPRSETGHQTKPEAPPADRPLNKAIRNPSRSILCSFRGRWPGARSPLTRIGVRADCRNASLHSAVCTNR